MCGETSASQSSVHADGGVGAAQATGETSKEMRRSISGGLREAGACLWHVLLPRENTGQYFELTILLRHVLGRVSLGFRDLNAGMRKGAHRITPEAEGGRGLPLTQRLQRYSSSANFTETAFDSVDKT